MQAHLARQPQEIEVEYLWPDNVRAWDIWIGLQTQWRVGPGGATGLDHTAVIAVLKFEGLRGRERRETFACIKAAELATLHGLVERREAERRRAGWED